MGGAGLWKVTDTVERIAFALILWVRSITCGISGNGVLPCLYPRIWGVRIASGFIKANSHRQRDLVGSAWKWAIGPIIPGLALLNTYLIVFPPYQPAVFGCRCSVASHTNVDNRLAESARGTTA